MNLTHFYGMSKSNSIKLLLNLGKAQRKRGGKNMEEYLDVMY